jgi:hypothetical protein
MKNVQEKQKKKNLRLINLPFFCEPQRPLDMPSQSQVAPIAQKHQASLKYTKRTQKCRVM